MLRRCLFLLVGLVVLGLPAGAAADEGCANEAQRPAGSYSSRLPDCRAFEQATPVNKDGSSPSGYENAVHASPSGDRIVFFAPANMPGAEGSESPTFFLAGRQGEVWSNQGLEAPFQPHGFNLVDGWSDDLSESLDLVGENSPGSGVGLYLRDSATGSLRLVADHLGRYSSVGLAGFSSDDSHMIFETSDQLLPSAVAGQTNLYEWHNGALSLAGVLPDGSTPPGGSFAGPYDFQNNNTEGGGASRHYYTQGTISGDGSRAFFTAGGTGQLYVRENGASTVRVSASQRTVPDPNGVKPAAFMAATPDGSRVFFTSCEKLTNDSTAVSTAEPSCGRSEGEDLYEYDVDSGALSDLTVDSNAGDVLGANVQGVLGVGSGPRGTYVYFAAQGALAGGSSPATCGLTGQVTCNLYLWHDDTVKLIAVLRPEGGEGDSYNWKATSGNGFGEERTSRVSTIGEALLFSSQLKLTSYDNDGQVELYRYDAASSRLVCVSCDPSGAPPTGRALLRSISGGQTFTEPSVVTRNISADGGRVFFESSDALVPQDTNGVKDVYEWEQVGAGSCGESSAGFSAVSGGCLYLISTGRSPDNSSFADASVNGDDVFVFTDQPLVGQDQDGVIDIYDARVGGGIAAQSPAVSAPCGGEACRGPAGSQPVFGAPSSSVFSGAGNLAAASVPVERAKAKKAKPKKRKHKPARKKRAKKARGSARHVVGKQTATRGGK